MSGTYVDRYLKPRPIRFYTLVVIGCALSLLIVALTTENRGRTVFGSNLGADFAAFYIAGSIYNRDGRGGLYDFTRQHEVYRQMFPAEPAESHLPYLYPPYFVIPFSLLARLPYKPAFVIWLTISLSLYLGGLRLVWRTLEYMPSDLWLTVCLLAASFMPFLLECWLGGQVSVWGLFLIALVLRCERLERPILSGLVLSLCSYKPTLLVLVVPMLFITRRFGALLGVGLGALLIVSGSLVAFGTRVNIDYLNTMRRYGEATSNGEFALRLWKYVDLNSSVRLLTQGQNILRWLLMIAIAGAVITLLIRVARRIWVSRDYDWDLVWATTLTWTLVLNVYVPIYDTILLVPSALLTVNALSRAGKGFWEGLLPSYQRLFGLLHIVPWITQALARAVGLQIYTLVVVALGVYQVKAIMAAGQQRGLRRHPPEESPVVPSG